ncbi:MULTISPECIES: methionine adenosyltransferase [unclassified Streptomyces]|uniref:methionine adenosyltransferase n=1 Tax=unclassified Streptomyces TaxID=2593676 RepID=UPI000DACD212|nr:MULTISPECIES: methionine adenosyltransferase [unclassified Streptomyces]PZT75746.1 S-adenosylmethionine synthetase [Streptomyces sp. AC1-42W]PZT80300.1 S-adenosylmethionine synthetase [Streptomyces sp. AC1-42T]
MPTATRAPFMRPVLPHDLDVEVVERKGIGHPDTLADGIAELASIRYSEYCLREFGAVLHHNLDKVAILGGRARFGDADGTYDRPVRVVFGGRISTTFGGRVIPVREILEAAAAEQLRTALPGHERITWVARHETTDSSKFRYWFAPRGLEDLPERPRAFSNDTAFLVGTAPRTTAEIVALLTESWFRRQPWAGSDIKALVIRTGHALTITVCVPAVAGHLAGSAEFDDAVTGTAQALTAQLRERLDRPVTVVCNTRNTRTGPLSGQYFTVSGSAVDFGEDGLVGRGNARSGLITPGQQAGNEVLFGKNPAYHVGKVGGWLVDEASRALAEKTGAPCRVAVTWRNGSPYPEPASVDLAVSHADPDHTDVVRSVLRRTDWVSDLVGHRRYLPTLLPVPNLLAELDASTLS